MHATLKVAAVLYIEALEMQLVSMYMCVCVLSPCVYGGEVISSHFVSVYGGGVTVVILSVHMGRGYRLGAFEYTD